MNETTIRPEIEHALSLVSELTAEMVNAARATLENPNNYELLEAAEAVSEKIDDAMSTAEGIFGSDKIQFIEWETEVFSRLF